MTILKVSTPAKTILFGEHAVVYGYPAIAVPVSQLRTKITISPNLGQTNSDIEIIAPQIGLDTQISELTEDHPFRIAHNKVLEALKIKNYPSCKVTINSDIPIASGLGSSAAISVGLIKAFSQFVGAVFPNQVISDLAFQVEVAYHGTPSGIDNTVISFEKPIFFQKNEPIRFINSIDPIYLLVTHSGIPGKTKDAVSGVRERWLNNPELYNSIFKRIGDLTQAAMLTLQSGDLPRLGELMDKNHLLLQKLEVSHPKIDQLVKTAKDHGALGSKICGGGLGGNLVTLVNADQIDQISNALIEAGANNNYQTMINGMRT